MNAFFSIKIPPVEENAKSRLPSWKERGAVWGPGRGSRPCSPPLAPSPCPFWHRGLQVSRSKAEPDHSRLPGAVEKTPGSSQLRRPGPPGVPGLPASALLPPAPPDPRAQPDPGPATPAPCAPRRPAARLRSGPPRRCCSYYCSSPGRASPCARMVSVPTAGGRGGEARLGGAAPRSDRAGGKWRCGAPASPAAPGAAVPGAHWTVLRRKCRLGSPRASSAEIHFHHLSMCPHL